MRGMGRHCQCGARLVTRSAAGSGIPRRVCPECDTGDLRADGGTYALPETGDRVRDRDADQDGEAIVLDVHPGTPASEHWIDGLNGTVADYNPDYDPSAPVVTIAFRSEVQDNVSGWRSLDDLKLAAASGAVKAHVYPAPRLEVVDR